MAEIPALGMALRIRRALRLATPELSLQRRLTRHASGSTMCTSAAAFLRMELLSHHPNFKFPELPTIHELTDSRYFRRRATAEWEIRDLLPRSSPARNARSPMCLRWYEVCTP